MGVALEHCPPGVRIHLRVEHEQVDVPPRSQDVVQAAVADVEGPAVAAHAPHALLGEVVGHGQQLAVAGIGAVRRPGALSTRVFSSATRARCRAISASSSCWEAKKRVHQFGAQGVS